MLDHIHRAFDKSPRSFAAFRLRHASPAFSWRVQDKAISGLDGGVVLWSIPLAGHTIKSLVSAMASMPGVSIPYSAPIDQTGISAIALLDGSGALAQSNGDVVSAYSSLLWMFLDAMAAQLVKARDTIVDMLDQMSVATADEDWLDEWGGYFAISRLLGEPDYAYRRRIIAEVIRPRGNNKAIELSLAEVFDESLTVTDTMRWGPASPMLDGAKSLDGTWVLNASALPVYGLFNVQIGYDLESGEDQAAYAALVAAQVDKMRDAGTHMDSLSLSGSRLTEEVLAQPADGSIALLVTVPNLLDGAWQLDSEHALSSTYTWLESV